MLLLLLVKVVYVYVYVGHSVLRVAPWIAIEVVLLLGLSIAQGLDPVCRTDLVVECFPVGFFVENSRVFCGFWLVWTSVVDSISTGILSLVIVLLFTRLTLLVKPFSWRVIVVVLADDILIREGEVVVLSFVLIDRRHFYLGLRFVWIVLGVL